MKLRRGIIWGSAVLYFLIYFILSAFGKYGISPTGGYKYSGAGISVTDRSQWDPYWGVLRLTGAQAFALDGIGFLYMPLIIIDRCLIHKEINYFE